MLIPIQTVLVQPNELTKDECRRTSLLAITIQTVRMNDYVVSVPTLVGPVQIIRILLGA